MDTEHPRDVDPSITGQPHQVTGKVPDLMGMYRGRLVTRWTCQRRYEFSYRRISARPPIRGLFLFHATLTRRASHHARVTPRARHAAPRWSASHTAVDSRAPSSIARPQWAIQAATPSGVPET
ncbi:hypothetical protein SUDANB176_04042 [Streptomyces sp. enrichment culture]